MKSKVHAFTQWDEFNSDGIIIIISKLLLYDDCNLLPKSFETIKRLTMSLADEKVNHASLLSTDKTLIISIIKEKKI